MLTRLEVGADGNAIVGQTETPPLFSRGAAAISRQAGSAIRQVTVTDVKNKLVDYRGIGLQALGRRQIMDLYGDLFPQGAKQNLLETYNKLAMQMDADKNEAGAEADTVTTNWAKLADERELAELMHDATRLQIDPSKPFVLGDIKRDYTDLSARYKALSPAARAIFHDASKAAGRAEVGTGQAVRPIARRPHGRVRDREALAFPIAGHHRPQHAWQRGSQTNSGIADLNMRTT